MDWQNNRRGCFILLALLILFAGIYFYASRDTSPSPSEGYMPPTGGAAPNGGGSGKT